MRLGKGVKSWRVLNRPTTAAILLIASFVSEGCQSYLIDRTDRGVYRLIEDKQKGALGATSNANIGPESGETGARMDSRTSNEMYSFTPHPTELTIPESFRKSRQDHATKTAVPSEPGGLATGQGPALALGVRIGTADAQAPEAGQDPTLAPGVVPRPVEDQNDTPALQSKSIFTEEEQSQVTVFGLSDALAYSMRGAREVQDAKEALYIAALDLTLERHLWTPQFVTSVQTEFADYGQVRDFDRAMSVVSNTAVTQRLPYGGEVTARVVNSLMRDLGVHTTSGESGNFILEANIPLFRGAGKVAYESRYEAERELIYAVRTYERFRRSFLVDVATDYFALQGLKMGITNTYVAYRSRQIDWERADFKNQLGQSKDVFDSMRAQSSFRDVEANLVSAKEQYAFALDRFKIRIGMPVETLLDVHDQDADEDAKALDDLLPDVDVVTAVDVAVRLRLDLLNTADQIDDARRGVLVAKNRILPDLNATGSATLDTDPERLNSTSYNTERTTWRGGVELRMDDRKAARNAYRASLIAMRKAERDFERSVDTVRADVRSAVRRVAQQEKLRAIQFLNVEENQLRLDAARAQYELGRLGNRDVVEAENDLLNARNSLARAVSAYRNAILGFRRDTETLRVTDDGLWERPEAEQPPNPTRP
jgi:outer membrane protein TolC